MEIFLTTSALKALLTLLAVIAGVFVITTKNAIISVFNLIVLYLLVAFYLIYIGITYIGISYIVVYIGAIAILFLFVIMMIDVEVIEKRNNNYLPLLFLLLGGFLVTLKNILYNLSIMKLRSISYEEKEKYFINHENEGIFNLRNNDFNDFNINTILLNKKINIDYSNSIISDICDDKLIFTDKDNYNIEFLDVNSYLNKESIYEKNINTNININSTDSLSKFIFETNNTWLSQYSNDISNNNYLLIMSNWDSAINRSTQISAIGDVLYTVYHSYIYIVSIILLLGMVGAIILTADTYQELRIINIEKQKNSSFFVPIYLINILLFYIFNNIKSIFPLIKNYNKEKLNNIKRFLRWNKKFLYSYVRNKNILTNKKILLSGISPFFEILEGKNRHSEAIMGNLLYFIIANIFIGFLLLFINSYFSLSIKYLDKGGGFECGFTSFVQTRERFNVIFYRVSLLFLVFDLEIILAFPYPAIYQKNQNISKNNILVFLYILVVGFIYELKEGALNIVKKAHSTEINT
jgi:NADH-ubiquinone oxidoreductase chain 6